MDKEMALKTAEQYLSYVRKKYPFENALLFGSFAKGTNHPDSDIDLAIIFKKVDDIIDRQGDLLKLRKDNELIIEPHPFRQSDFNTLDPVAYEIMKLSCKTFDTQGDVKEGERSNVL